MNNKNQIHLKIPDVITPQKIQMRLRTNLIGHDIHHFQMLESTNNYLKEEAGKGAQDGLVVITEVQRSGKGRMGRLWLSPPGGVWLSILLRPKISPAHAPKITLMAGVAVAKTIKELFGLEPKLKWPNDVLINDRKVCGILTEMSADQNNIDFIVVGIGINANVNLSEFPNKLKGLVTSLLDETGNDIQRVDFIVRLLEQFDELYLKFKKQMFGSTMQSWKQYSDTLGRSVEIATETDIIHGQALDLGSNGELIIMRENGKKEHIIAGDCIYLRRS
jgi:BirA family biotin operon repressor/biotin-[acetyl-CoA-carboxylase] ligase